MVWDGVERRQHNQQSFCSQHIDFASGIAVIKESVVEIKDSIIRSGSFKNGIVGSLIGIAVTIIIQASTFAYFYGQISKQVEVNTERLYRLEQIYTNGK